MKKIYLSLLGVISIISASAQLSVGVNANYTMYKGDFQRSTPGAQIRVSYPFSDQMEGVLSFTYGIPIKQASSTLVYDQYGNTLSVPSEVKSNFKTFNLLVHRTFVGDAETAGRFYGIAGFGYVLVNMKEAVTGSYDHTKYSPSELYSASANGFTLNFGIGGSYNMGSAVLFGEAGLGLPANKVNDQYVENVIPAHFIFNAGVKIPLGSNE